ncbi:hypothetical protein ACFFX0_25695 [Citricoccus parietis]|uniref:Uncharacterized protein n=1 Tax=Citricoccus parietis TaxID=592307 RepID=A0ABV5G636_9MICC
MSHALGWDSWTKAITSSGNRPRSRSYDDAGTASQSCESRRASMLPSNVASVVLLT